MMMLIVKWILIKVYFLKITIDDYLKQFIKPTKTNYEKKKPKRFVMESDD